MAVLWVLGCIFAFLCLARLTFTLLFSISACVCVLNDTATETSGNHIFSQDLRNWINMAGALVEAENSFLIILLIFCWGKFNVRNLFHAAPRLAAFWFWIGLFTFKTISLVNNFILPDHEQWMFLGVSKFLESATLILLSLALKFIGKSTVKAWINRTVASEHFAGYLYFLYIFTLWMYLLRNLAVLLYGMATFAKEIDRHASDKQIDNILLIAGTAFRGSFVQFFYATIFRNPNLSTVCKGQSAPREEVFPISIEDSADSQPTLIAWEPSYVK